MGLDAWFLPGWEGCTAWLGTRQSPEHGLSRRLGAQRRWRRHYWYGQRLGVEANRKVTFGLGALYGGNLEEHPSMKPLYGRED